MPRTAIALLIVFLSIRPLWGSSQRFLDEYPAIRDATRLLEIWIDEQLAWRQIPGLSIGIVYQQELIWGRGFGHADLDNEIPATTATAYRIGSVTKLFTATAILQLRDRGKLELDDPVVQHLPWFRLQDTSPQSSPITIQHLLTHTAGLPREGAFPYWTDHEFPSRDELIAALAEQSTVYPPAKTYKYSNLGMAVLGEIVRSVSGQEYADYIRENIFAPLGMDNSAVIPDQALRARLAVPYLRRQADGRRDTFHYYETEALAPAANIVSTVEDLARFAVLHLREPGQESDLESVLRPATAREMQRPHWVYPSWDGGRGLGFGISRRNGKTLVSHSGWIGGYRSHFLLVPDEALGIVVMLNSDDGSPSDFALAALDTVGPTIQDSTIDVEPEPEEDPEWQRLLGLYSDPWGWQYEVLVIDRQLVMYEHNYPPEESAAASLTHLSPVSAGTFKMPDGELVVFELDTMGRVERIRRRYDFLYPVEP